MPRRAEAAAATRTALIDAALELLRECGPVEFRIDELVRRTGVSIGGIYHHFGDRSGLLREAYVSAIEEVQRHDTEVLAAMLTSIDSVEALVAGLRQLTVETISPARLAAREMRIEALALARRDPELLRRIIEVQTEVADAHIDAFRELQRRGWMKAEVDPYMFFLSIAGNTLGTIQDHIGPHRLESQAWADHTIALFAGFAGFTGDTNT